MRRGFKSNFRPEKSIISNSRWRLVLIIIFLFSGSLIYKLFSVQIKQCDLYTAMAAGQQQVGGLLKPERGKIFFTGRVNSEEKLYSVASNKEMAVLYAVPKDVVNPEELAEKFYDFFDRPLLEEDLKREIEKKSSDDNIEPLSLEVATSTKEKVIDTYLNRLDKPNSLYQPLENKRLEINTLLQFFAFLGQSSYEDLSADDLELRGGRILLKDPKSFDASAAELKIPGIGFDIGKFRHYPENDMGSHLLGFVSYADNDEQGKYGLEEFFNTELFGRYGSVKTDRAGADNILIVNDREYIKPEDGHDLVLTIDRNVQSVVCQKLKDSVRKHGAAGGSVIAMDPKTGAIIAMCSEPSFNPNDYRNVKDISYFNNPALAYQYEPGSVFKAITIAIAIDQGKISPATTFNDEGQIMISGWPRPIRNSDFRTHGAHGVVDMNTVLEKSLNTGAIFAMRQAGPAIFADYLKKFGFGERSGLELGSESPGNIGNLLSGRVKEIDAATASFGQGIAVTPLQMLSSYQVLANGGLMMKPYVVKAIVRDGQREEIGPKEIRQVVSSKTAATVSAMLVNVVEKGHSQKAYIDGYYIGGKTGTAQVATAGGYSGSDYIHTFIGIAPIDEPAFVMLTKIDHPKDVKYAEGSVVPLWKDIADFMLKYYQVPKTRK